MKKISVVLPIVFILILTGGAIAQTVLSEDIQTLIKEIQKDKGINESEITNVKEISFSDNLEQIKDRQYDIRKMRN